MEKIAVLLPCYNEEVTIGKVIDDVRQELPEAEIFVFDNNSNDRSVEIVRAKGIEPVMVMNRGKGEVIKSMFATVEADIYIMLDSDDTYDTADIHKLVEAIREGSDMVVGDRLSTSYYKENKRSFHNIGNSSVLFLTNWIFGGEYKDVMTGYRGFSRRFVKEIDLSESGFTIETEMSIRTLLKSFKVTNVPINYRDRPTGSYSKLSTYKDGMKVLLLIAKYGILYRPFHVFFPLNAILFLLSLIMMSIYFGRIATGMPIFITMIVALALFGFMMMGCTIIKLLTGRSFKKRDPKKVQQ